jgi:ribosomal protein S27AE
MVKKEVFEWIRTGQKTRLRMKCKQCGHWNRIEVEKVLFNPDSPEPKVQVFLPSYLPLKTEKCSKCGYIIAEEKEIIRIIKGS